MKIARRIDKGTKEIVQEVELFRKLESSVLVRLPNGDVIKRKEKDVVEW